MMIDAALSILAAKSEDLEN